jgi:O-antigen/teichoic acid export membrane protein
MQRGVGFNLLAAGFNQGSTLLVHLVVANLLGRELFGRYTIVLATVSTVAALAQLSMGYTATKHVAEFRLAAREKTSRVLGLCGAVAAVSALIAGGVLVAVADWLAGAVLGFPDLAVELRIAAVSAVFVVLNGFFTGGLAGLESYRVLAKAGVAAGTFYLLAGAAGTWLFGLRGAVGAVAVSAAAQSLLLGALLYREAARQEVPPRFSGLWQERRLVTRFAIPASLHGILNLPAVWLASALLAAQPGGFHQLALFGAAANFRTMVLFVPQAVNNVGMSLLNNRRRANPAEYRQVFWMNAGITAAAAFAVAGAVWAAATPLLGLFGPGFAEGRGALRIMLAAGVAEALAVAAYQLVVAQGRIWGSFFAVSVPRDLGILALAAVLVPGLGAAGLALAHASGWALALIGILAMLAWGRRRPGPAAPAMPVF